MSARPGRSLRVRLVVVIAGLIGVLAPTAVDKKFGTGGSEGNLFAPIDRVRATISGFGPLAGVVFSAKSPETVDAAINGVQPLIDGPTVLLAAGLSVVIGVFFGTYPAVRAARMNPVEALRVGT